ncbi:MAG: hypothetical protein ABI967_12710 [bacterium]
MGITPAAAHLVSLIDGNGTDRKRTTLPADNISASKGAGRIPASRAGAAQLTFFNAAVTNRALLGIDESEESVVQKVGGVREEHRRLF